MKVVQNDFFKFGGERVKIVYLMKKQFELDIENGAAIYIKHVMVRQLVNKAKPHIRTYIRIQWFIL